MGNTPSIWRLIKDALNEPENRNLFEEAYNAAKASGSTMALNNLQKHPYYGKWAN